MLLINGIAIKKEYALASWLLVAALRFATSSSTFPSAAAAFKIKNQAVGDQDFCHQNDQDHYSAVHL